MTIGQYADTFTNPFYGLLGEAPIKRAEGSQHIDQMVARVFWY
jgi:hypothetical protein